MARAIRPDSPRNVLEKCPDSTKLGLSPSQYTRRKENNGREYVQESRKHYGNWPGYSHLPTPQECERRREPVDDLVHLAQPIILSRA